MGPIAEYYSARYVVGLLFGAGGLELRMIYNGEIMGYVECDYD